MPKRFVQITAGAVALLIAVIAVEVVFTLRRDFLRADPDLPIRGKFGDPSLPRLRFAVLGDSTSVGLGTVPEASFPWRLASRLGERFHVDLVVLGSSGAKTADVAADQVPRAIDLEPDLVLIEIGANDATHVTPMREVRAQMRQAIRALSAAKIDVVVAGPPAMGTSRAFPQPLRALSGLNGRRVRRTIESEARRQGVSYIELASKTRDAFKNDPARLYSPDGFHPGAAGYELWADVMYPGILQAAKAAVRYSGTGA